MILHFYYYWFDVPGGGASRTGETERGAVQHPKTQRAAPVHYAAVQRHVKTLSPWQPRRETAEFCSGNGEIIDATPCDRRDRLD